jgi:starch-binding outer membrane protein SusE/F
MKTKIITFIICCLAFFVACEKDGSLIRVFGIDSSELKASESSIVLSKETSASSVLALTWSESDLSVSDESVSLPSSVPNEIIEVSATNNFSEIVEITPQSNTYAFLGAALNTLAKDLGFAAGESTPLYFRVRSALGSNTEPHFSNVAAVDVTCYAIDMTIGFILDVDSKDTGFTLYSPASDGEYSGFTGSGAWFNWFLLEGDGTTWGNLGEDGNEFVLSSDAGTHWNFWYPGQSGCYYTTLSTVNEEWTATYIPALTVSGAIDATMTFDRPAVKWYVSFTTTTDNATIKVKCDNASLYNKTTGTVDASAVAKTIGFIPHTDSTLTIDWNSASAGDITIAKAGEYTLTFYLADPKAWTYQIKSGATVIVEPLSKYLYLPGIDDGISGSWTFDNYLRLVNEDDSTFAGSVLVNSLWGYNMSLIKDEWTEVYKMGSTEGTLAFKGANNITAPTAGLYLIKADLKNLTYSHTPITSLGHAGLNNDWNLAVMDATTVPGVYSSSVTISAASPYGCQLIINEDWATYYGGTDGVLNYKGSNILDDATIAAGTYDLIADIRNNSYVFLGDEVYITGLNNLWDFTKVVLTKSSTGVYTGKATISAPSTYGMTIQIDQSWDRFFGGSFGSLIYLGANITDDQELAVGTYDVTVDFINNTCAFVVE